MKLILAIEEEFYQSKPIQISGYTEDKKIREENFEKWLKNYLSNYRLKDQERLGLELIKSMYMELILKNKTEPLDGEWLLNWGVKTFFLYKMFKPYLSEEKAKLYAKPLKDFYYCHIKQPSTKELEEDLETKKAKELIEEILGIESPEFEG